MQDKSILNLPTAIIFAGIIIAGGLFLGLKSDNSTNNDKNIPNNESELLKVRLIDQTDYLLGSPNADLTIIEYSDLECPACKFFHSSLTAVMDKYAKDGKVAWAYRHFPLSSLHSQSVKESEATLCAGKLGGSKAYWELINKIFEITPSNNGLDLSKLPDYATSVGLEKNTFEQCLESGEMTDRIEKEYNEAITAKAAGTPFTFIVLKNKLGKEATKNFDTYVKLRKLVGQDGKPLVKVLNNGKIVTLEAAFYPDDLMGIIEELLK